MITSKDSLAFCIAFAKDENTLVYREQAKLMLESLVTFGEWAGNIVVFTNLKDRPLIDELPAHIRPIVQEIHIDFTDWSCGKEGKLPSARFRIQAWKYLQFWQAQAVLYLDTDCIVRGVLERLLGELAYSKSDIMGAGVANRNMGRSKWFYGHITPEHEADAERIPPVQSGTIIFRGETFPSTCKVWEEIDKGPPRPGVHPNLVTDQSSHNLFHLLSSTGKTVHKSGILSTHSVACPHVGQRKTLGHGNVNAAAIWHFWHLYSQEDRVVAMRSELDRLHRALHPAPSGLIGKWIHEKPKEKIKNHWTFLPDGLVTVDNPAICGRWEWRDDHVLIDWLWGWEKVYWPNPPRLPRENTMHGESFRNGAFTLTHYDPSHPDRHHSVDAHFAPA